MKHRPPRWRGPRGPHQSVGLFSLRGIAIGLGRHAVSVGSVAVILGGLQMSGGLANTAGLGAFVGLRG